MVTTGSNETTTVFTWSKTGEREEEDGCQREESKILKPARAQKANMHTFTGIRGHPYPARVSV
jgi:hypothetical protein